MRACVQRSAGLERLLRRADARLGHRGTGRLPPRERVRPHLLWDVLTLAHSGFMGLAAARGWSLSRCCQYEGHGASQQLGFMINYYQDELLIDMSLETKGTYLMVAVSIFAFFPLFELDPGHLRELARASVQRGICCVSPAGECQRAARGSQGPAAAARGGGTGGNTAGGTWVWGQIHLFVQPLSRLVRESVVLMTLLLSQTFSSYLSAITTL